MTRLLASVRDLAEARIAFAAGADIIDLKEPANGALGAVGPAVIKQVVAWVARRRPVSATVGDLPMEPSMLTQAVMQTASLGIDFVKVGLLPDDHINACVAGLAAVAARTRLVAVLFADRRLDLGLVEALARHRFAGVMLDTADKSCGSLLAQRRLDELRDFVDNVNAHGMIAGLAGSLRAGDVPILLPLRADYLGFRGALCARGARTGQLSAGRIADLRMLICADAAALAMPQLA